MLIAMVYGLPWWTSRRNFIAAAISRNAIVLGASARGILTFAVVPGEGPVSGKEQSQHLRSAE